MTSTIVTSDRFVPGVPDVDKWDKWTSGQVDMWTNYAQPLPFR